jgi:hypothetical protein
MTHTDLWRFEEHVCGHCFGRIMSRLAEDGGRTFRCADCETEAKDVVRALCACGFSVGRREIGLRCARNDHREAGYEAAIVVREGAGPQGGAGIR